MDNYLLQENNMDLFIMKATIISLEEHHNNLLMILEDMITHKINGYHSNNKNLPFQLKNIPNKDLDIA